MAIHFYEKSHPISPGDCCVGAVPENMNHCYYAMHTVQKSFLCFGSRIYTQDNSYE